jgi:hypothetical protein
MESHIAKHTTIISLDDFGQMKGDWQELMITCKGRTNSGINIRVAKNEY